jgi:hypothetical protein
MKGKVGIIGGAGFIGSYVTQKFLEEGYTVNVSTKNIRNKMRYQHLHNLKGNENLKINPIDLMDKTSLRLFLQDCEMVIHAGTPFQLNVRDPQKELFEPTILGTENLLEVVAKNPHIRKLVIVASVAAYNTDYPLSVATRPVDYVYTENDIPFARETSHPYAQAKFHADQAVQHFIDNHPDLGCEIVNLYPVFVVGNSLSERRNCASQHLQMLIKNNIAPDAYVAMLFQQDVELAMITVADVAKSIYRAAIKPGLHNERFLLSSESWRVSDIASMLNGQEPNGSPRIVYSNQKAKQVLGINFQSVRNTLMSFRHVMQPVA